jgi:hypothetical protein
MRLISRKLSTGLSFIPAGMKRFTSWWPLVHMRLAAIGSLNANLKNDSVGFWEFVFTTLVQAGREALGVVLGAGVGETGVVGEGVPTKGVGEGVAGREEGVGEGVVGGREGVGEGVIGGREGVGEGVGGGRGVASMHVSAMAGPATEGQPTRTLQQRMALAGGSTQRDENPSLLLGQKNPLAAANEKRQRSTI